MSESMTATWTGSPAAMATALSTIGWVPNNMGQTPNLHVNVINISPVSIVYINSAVHWTCSLILREALAHPEDVTVVVQGAEAVVVQPPPTPMILKQQVFGAMTEAEAAAFEARLNEMTPRARMLWQSNPTIDISDTLTQEMLADVLTAERYELVMAAARGDVPPEV